MNHTDFVELESGQLRIAINPLGAELSSVLDQEGREYMWQGDPSIWAGRAPILFPTVGNLRGQGFTHQGTRYRMASHGFARRQIFEIEDSSETEAVFTLESNDETQLQYPFEFRLEIHFHLDGDLLSIRHSVFNLGDDSLFYALGAHPGFSCDWDQLGSNWQPSELNRYYIEFDQQMTLPEYCLSRTGDSLVVESPDSLLNGTDTVRLSPDVFSSGARIYRDIPSRCATLKKEGDSREIRVNYPDFPHLGIWAKPEAPYVCIEPWLKTADRVDEPGEISKKRDMRRLEQGRMERFDMSIQFAVS